ncbi:MAG: DivIVA domain-containing protein [Bacilli bacterium]
MLTVNDIRDVKFRKTNIGGYKAEDVDNFLDEVQDSYEKLQRENLNLTQKIKILADRVSQYRKDEDSVRDALVGAQKLANSELAKAKAEAANIIEKAQKEADSILKNANSDIKNQKETLVNLKKAVRDFRSDILSRYKEHLKLVNSFNAEDRLPINFNDKNNEKLKEFEPDKLENIRAFESTEGNSNLENEDELNNNYSGKFSDLRFGEDYDVREDTK